MQKSNPCRVSRAHVEVVNKMNWVSTANTNGINKILLKASEYDDIRV